MVSLGGSAKKGMSFEEPSDNDGNIASHDVYSEDGGSQNVLISSTNEITNVDNVAFKRVETLWISLFMLFLPISLFTLSAVVPFECENNISESSFKYTPNQFLFLDPRARAGPTALCYVKPTSLLLYLQALLWAIYLICDQCVRYEHQKVRRRGYLEFYNETKVISELPFWVVSAWNTLLLVVSSILNDHCVFGKQCGKTIRLTQTEYITICIGLQTLALSVVISNYIYQVWRFNASKVPPDALQEEMMSSTLDYNPDIMGRIDEEVFHRQADLIRYFKERNSVLQRTVLQLHNRMHGGVSNQNA